MALTTELNPLGVCQFCKQSPALTPSPLSQYWARGSQILVTLLPKLGKDLGDEGLQTKVTGAQPFCLKKAVKEDL